MKTRKTTIKAAMLCVVTIAGLVALSGCDYIEDGNADGMAERLQYRDFDGHEYVVSTSPHGGITHSPKCKCLND